MDENTFIQNPSGKWSAGQHLDHLIKSGKPILMVLKLPHFLLRLFFGRPNRTGRSYEELVKKYRSKLDAGGKAPGRFIPPVVSFPEKDRKIDFFRSLKEKLKKEVAKLSEEQLDNYLLPHPLLGKLTLREMLFFTIYHNQHHLQNHQRDMLNS